MKLIKITSDVKKSQYNEVKNIYTDFFRNINYDSLYTEDLIDTFARKKTLDVFNHDNLCKYFFAINENEIIGFIHGKIVNDIGLISHAYVKEEYRKQLIFAVLSKKLLSWFKQNNINLIEIEVNKNNTFANNIEGKGWRITRSFDDANIYQRKI